MYRLGTILAALLTILAGVIIADGARIMADIRGNNYQEPFNPGEYVLVLGVALIITTAAYYLLEVRPLAGKEQASSRQGSGWRKVALSSVALFLYVFLVPIAGYLLTTALFMVAMFRLIGNYPWLKSLGMGAGISLILFFIFVNWANMPLPANPLGF